jgi:hypothetical protein
LTVLSRLRTKALFLRKFKHVLKRLRRLRRLNNGALSRRESLTAASSAGPKPKGRAIQMFKRKHIIFGGLLAVATGAALFSSDGPARLDAYPAPSKTTGKDVSELEEKLHGIWIGHGGCVGEFTFRAGIYERRNEGPAGVKSSGSWEIRWDALPPTLILKCTKSRFKEMVGKTLEVKVVQLDDKTFSYQSPEDDQPTVFTRKSE